MELRGEEVVGMHMGIAGDAEGDRCWGYVVVVVVEGGVVDAAAAGIEVLGAAGSIDEDIGLGMLGRVVVVDLALLLDTGFAEVVLVRQSRCLAGRAKVEDHRCWEGSAESRWTGGGLLSFQIQRFPVLALVPCQICQSHGLHHDPFSPCLCCDHLCRRPIAELGFP